MTDLRVDQVDIDAARVRLTAAATPIAGSCGATGAIGSSLVASAVSEVDAIFGTALGVLTGAAEKAAGDLGGIGAALDETDTALAGGNP